MKLARSVVGEDEEPEGDGYFVARGGTVGEVFDVGEVHDSAFVDAIDR